MKKNQFIRLMVMAIAMATTGLAWAGPINEYQAQTLASELLKGKTLQRVALQHGNKAPGQSHAAYYVFNAQSGMGYAIVAGDDRVPAVLGYSDNGTFDPNDIPPAMQTLLDGYAAQIEALPEAMQAPERVSRTPIAPLISSHWGQGEPYNIYLPFTRTTTSSDGTTRAMHAKTGCVATAMAQVMYYHKWPPRSTATIPAYTSQTTSSGTTLTFYRPALSTTTFDWASMKLVYNSTDSSNAQGKAVAKLMQYCDQALEMQFYASSSSAKTKDIVKGLVNYFNYDASMYYVRRSNYQTTAWENLLYNELQAHRPVVYRGDKNPGGHAFVVDGCDNAGLFHINWGWNSLSDGYFMLRDLNPDAQGIGGSDGECGYIYDQGMILGIMPNVGGTATMQVYFNTLTINSTTTTRSSSSGNFSINLTGRYGNDTPNDEQFDYGWGLYQGQTLKSVLWQTSRTSPLRPNYYTEVTRTLSFGSGLSNGTYYLRPIFKEQNQGSTWTVCEGGMVNYVTAVISNNNCTFTQYGSTATPSYVVNNVSFAGTLNTGKQVNVTANVTNKGNSPGTMIYIFVDGVKTTSALSDLEANQSGNLVFHFTPTVAGTKTIMFSLNENGSNPLATRTVTIKAMPAANLQITNQLLNVTDAANRIITSDKFSVKSTIKNNGTTAYNEEVTMRLYLVNNGTSGTNVQDVSILVNIPVGGTQVVQFDCDNVINGQKYFAWVYYFSEGSKVQARGTSSHTIVFPTTPQYAKGDVNGDGTVDISDVNAIINIMLGKAQASSCKGDPNVDGQGGIDIGDANAIINIMLGK